MTIQELAEILARKGLSVTIRTFHGVWRVDLRTATDLPAGGALAASLQEALEAALKKA